MNELRIFIFLLQRVQFGVFVFAPNCEISKMKNVARANIRKGAAKLSGHWIKEVTHSEQGRVWALETLGRAVEEVKPSWKQQSLSMRTVLSTPQSSK